MSKRSPRLLFSEEERATPELEKSVRKADKAADKLEKAEAKIPKKTVRHKERVVTPDGKVTTRLSFEEVEKGNLAPNSPMRLPLYPSMWRRAKRIGKSASQRMIMWVLKAHTNWRRQPRAVCGHLNTHIAHTS